MRLTILRIVQAVSVQTFAHSAVSGARAGAIGCDLGFAHIKTEGRDKVGPVVTSATWGPYRVDGGSVIDLRLVA